MIYTFNRHGPHSDLMQGDGLSRGSPVYPVGNPYVLVIEPPGYRRTMPGNGSLTTGQKDQRYRPKRSSGSLIVYGLPVMSQTGRPEYSPPYATHQPDSQLVTVTVKHNLIDVRGSLCAKHSEFSCQLSAIREPKTKNKEQFLEQRTKNKEQFLEQRTKNKEQSSKSLMSKNQ